MHSYKVRPYEYLNVTVRELDVSRVATRGPKASVASRLCADHGVSVSRRLD